MRATTAGLALGVLLFAASFSASGRPPPKVPRIAFLAGGSRSADAVLLETFWQRMRKLGYIDGQNIAAEYRFAEGALERLPSFAADWPFTEDYNAKEQEGFGIGQWTIRNGRRCGAAVAFLRPAMRRPNLTVETSALATRVILEGTSAMPDLVSGNINACVLMIAEKAADLVLGQPPLSAVATAHPESTRVTERE